jgi:hypothetical protein
MAEVVNLASMGGAGFAEARAQTQAMPTPWQKQRLPMQAEAPQGPAQISSSAWATGDPPGPTETTMPPGQAGAPEFRRPRTHQQGPSTIDLMRQGGSPMAQPEPVPSLHADVATMVISASGSSATIEAGMSLPQAVPTAPGNPMTNVSTNQVGKVNGFPDGGAGPGTGRPPRSVAGKTAAKPRTPFDPRLYRKS